MRARTFLAALTALAALVLPSAASASTLDRTGGIYTYTGGGNANSMSMTASPGTITVTDTENITVTGNSPDNCQNEGSMSVTCTVTPTDVSVDLGGNNDIGNVTMNSFTTPFPLAGEGGAGNDNLTISASFGVGAASTATLDDASGNDVLALNVTAVSGDTQFGYGTLNGGSGDDVVSGTSNVNGQAGFDQLRGFPNGSGNATLNGGSEDDTFKPADNVSEVMQGSTGTDTVDYSVSGQTTVTLDGVKNDGPSGQIADNANQDLSVENVITGPSADTVTGSSGNNLLVTNGEADTLDGGGGDDTLDGGTGPDVLIGGTNGAGGDTVTYESRTENVRATPTGSTTTTARPASST